MSVGSKAVLAEYVVACLYNTVVVDVDIGNVNPCAHKVGAHVEIVLLEIVDVFVEEREGLQVGTMLKGLLLGQPHTVEGEALVEVGCLHQHSCLASVEWRLSHNAARSLRQNVGV